jgi:Cu/Ag efflux protein CusF
MNKKKNISILTASILGIVVGLVLAAQVRAQEKKAEATPKEDRLSGTIQMINKDDSTITLRKGNITRTVVYNNNTKVTKHNKPGSLDEVKEGRRVICLGQFDDRTRLVATRIDVRDENP